MADEQDFIELNAYLKKISLATTGGQAKTIIRSGEILVSGTVDTRNKKKLHDNDVVEYQGKKYVVRLE